MNKFITPTILIIVSGIIFFTLTDATFSRIKEVQKEGSQYNQALTKSKELQELRDGLLAKYNNISTTDLDDLKKMIPDHVDNVRLIIEIDNIASQYGMTVRNAKLVTNKDNADSTIFDVQSRTQEDVTLSFSVISSYDNFLKFIRDLEQSLRIVDIEKVEFESSEVDLNEYFISVKTYWLSSE